MEKIVLITSSFPERETGAEAAGSFVFDFAKTLAEQVRVRVVAPGRTGSHEDDGHLEVRRFAVPRLPLSSLNPIKPVDWSAIVATLTRGQQAVDSLLRDQPADHLLALWALPCGYWARKAKKSYGTPYSVWALGSDIWAMRKFLLTRRVLVQVLKESDRRFADGQQLAANVEQLCGLPCQFLPSSRRLPPPVQKALRTAPPYRLAFLGRWHVNKGADILAESLSLLTPDKRSLIEEVRVAGGGPLEQAVRRGCERARSRGVPVTVLGYLDRGAACELLAWADYLLIPSRIESIPVVFSDAMQMGTPVVTTPVGDLPALIQMHQVGIAAKAVSAEAFCRALGEALSTPPSQYSANLANTARIFSVDETVNRFLAAIQH